MHDLGLAARFADRFLLLENRTVATDGEAEAALRNPATRRVYGVEIDVAQRVARWSWMQISPE